ncbi:translation initiation factor IF-2-like [Vulpes lagopus]|uniref:translation initiation factor IF-2-like n=1 Tax=Vulpes lagopus TaxID=494514 RepID=UPI001BC8E1CB|nr:translation initiation factor IF-2-like [Vulpes lagopus]
MCTVGDEASCSLLCLKAMILNSGCTLESTTEFDYLRPEESRSIILGCSSTAELGRWKWRRARRGGAGGGRYLVLGVSLGPGRSAVRPGRSLGRLSAFLPTPPSHEARPRAQPPPQAEATGSARLSPSSGPAGARVRGVPLATGRASGSEATPPGVPGSRAWRPCLWGRRAPGNGRGAATSVKEGVKVGGGRTAAAREEPRVPGGRLTAAVGVRTACREVPGGAAAARSCPPASSRPVGRCRRGTCCGLRGQARAGRSGLPRPPSLQGRRGGSPAERRAAGRQDAEAGQRRPYGRPDGEAGRGGRTGGGQTGRPDGEARRGGQTGRPEASPCLLGCPASSDGLAGPGKEGGRLAWAAS